MFKKYDVHNNGKLSISEFKSLLNNLYPTLQDDEIKTVFRDIDKDGEMEFNYMDNIEDLTKELKDKYNASSLPDKQEFLQIITDVFVDKTYAAILSECKSYDELNRDIDDKVELVQHIRNEYMKNIKRSGHHQVEIAKTCVEDLWRWIEERGITAVRHRENAQNKYINHG